MIKVHKKLRFSNQRAKGRNNQGKITSRHRGGGNKRLFRKIDLKRDKMNIYGQVIQIEIDPNRNSPLALIKYEDGDIRYCSLPKGLEKSDWILASASARHAIGNTLPLKQMPLGSQIHNLEIQPRTGFLNYFKNGNWHQTATGTKCAQFIRSPGTTGQILAKESGQVTVRLPSKEVRLFNENCWATLGILSEANNVGARKQAPSIMLGNEVASQRQQSRSRQNNPIKAGMVRWNGRRPKVRGSAMNACDHPHGGGEGKAPIGRKSPMTFKGKIALGKKTRSPKKYSQKWIIRRS